MQNIILVIIYFFKLEQVLRFYLFLKELNPYHLFKLYLFKNELMSPYALRRNKIVFYNVIYLNLLYLSEIFLRMINVV